MDPRASIAEARQLGLKPPPRPAPPQPGAQDVDDRQDVGEESDGAPAGRRAKKARSPQAKPPRPTATVEIAELPGFARGNRRALTVSLPRATLVKLRRESEGSTMGLTVVNALRASYPWLVETYKQQPVEAVGPFPAPVRQRRRSQVEDPAPVHLYMSPAEAAAVAAVADECDLSISELVTVGLEHHFAQPPPSAGATSTKRRTKTAGRVGKAGQAGR